MAYWLAKSEPSTYSWDDLVKEKQTCWSGIRNYAARIHMRNMKKGDEVFFYHSNEGVEIVGIAKVIKEAYPDPTTDDDRWVAVDLKPVRKLKNPVTLDAIKKAAILAPTDATILYNLGVLYGQNNDSKKAIEILKSQDGKEIY